jgi:undecaprenyl-diphosphatase
MHFPAAISVVIQGITEFFPVSSTAHLYFFSKIFEDHQVSQVDAMALNLIPGLVFTLYFYKDICRLLSGFIAMCSRSLPINCNVCVSNQINEEYFKFFFWSTLPISIIGLLVSLFGISAPTSVQLIAVNSIVFGMLLGWADAKGRQRELLGDVLPSRAGKILGIVHVLSYIPGVSRLGICITATRFTGISRDTAIRVSFICGIPPMLATGIWGLYQSFWGHAHALHTDIVSTLGLHFVVMVPLGFASIYVFTRMAKKHGLLAIAIYRVLLGIGLFVMF